MKSQLNFMAQVSLTLLKEGKEILPVGSVCDRDITRFSRLVEDRGIGFLTTDLPGLDTILLGGLETSLPSFSGPLTRSSRGSKLPIFLRGVWCRIFNDSGVLLPEPCVDSIAFIRQFTCLWKSLFEVCSEVRVKDAIQEYILDERSIKSPTLSWREDKLNLDEVQDISFAEITSSASDSAQYDFGFGVNSVSRPDDSLLVVFQLVCDFFAESLESKLLSDAGAILNEDQSDWFEDGSFGPGPGSIANGLFKEDKFLFENWPSRLEARFPYHLVTGGYSTPRLLLRSSLRPSKLIAVPKTSTKPRLICSEPNEMMWTQQHIWKWLRRNLGCLGRYIDFGRQDLSRDMAKIGSIDKSISTIDLKSASDLLSLYALERAFRKSPSFLELVHATRTPLVVYPTGDIQWKNKALTQGTALTFPVQTIVFALATISACVATSLRTRLLPTQKLRLTGIDGTDSSQTQESGITYVQVSTLRDIYKLVSGGNPPSTNLLTSLLRATGFDSAVRVFGDDIIVPTPCFSSTTEILSLIGLKVNSNKSFTLGFFRESCGGDYYKGYDVAPVRLRSAEPTSPGKMLALVDNSNNLFKKGWWKTSCLLSELGGLRLPVRTNPGPLELYSFSGNSDPSVKRRWNTDYQREEILVPVAKTRNRGTEPHCASLLLSSLKGLYRKREGLETLSSIGNRKIVEELRIVIRKGWKVAA